jgi:hypothetical protein
LYISSVARLQRFRRSACEVLHTDDLRRFDARVGLAACYCNKQHQEKRYGPIHTGELIKKNQTVHRALLSMSAGDLGRERRPYRLDETDAARKARSALWENSSRHCREHKNIFHTAVQTISYLERQ